MGVLSEILAECADTKLREYFGVATLERGVKQMHGEENGWSKKPNNPIRRAGNNRGRVLEIVAVAGCSRRCAEKVCTTPVLSVSLFFSPF